MQRAIKFRALTQEGQIIQDVGSIQFFTDGTILVNDEFPVKRLMQFTGLKDKNGKEIYEGDVLEVAKRIAYEVLFINQDDSGEMCAAFGIKNGDESFPIDEYAVKNGEIIGNIYENPELLKA